jgi:hypothetical protein
MGSDGMAEHAMHIENGLVKAPDNSLPMHGSMGPSITPRWAACSRS